MNKSQLKNLKRDRWFRLSLLEQMANVGMDVERTINWRNRGEAKRSGAAFERALELLDLTIADPKNRKRLKEPCRVREALVDYFIYDNEYGSTDEAWSRYFYYFAYAAAIQKGK